MKQKLGLCCALIHDPDLLILDEPTTGVDPLSRRQFWKLISRMRGRREAMSVIVATAYMEEAQQFDWLVAMDEGRVLAAGTPQQIRERGNSQDLDSAFIQLLPEHRRRDHQTLVVPPRTIREGDGAAILARGLTRRFGDFVAVDHVSFEIQRGEIFGFLGSNGSGKTTTMKMLTGLLPASEGNAQLFGHPVAAGDLETRKRVGYMSQSFSLYGELTVRHNLELHAQLFGLDAETQTQRIRTLIERFDLQAHSEAPAASLPLGIRQRLSLAVAVVHQPEMLILDEPTSGVDPVARDRFWQLLIDLSRRQGVTIFISTHFMNEAERCDRISFMHAGRVLASDTPLELKRAQHTDSLDAAFIAYLEQAQADAGAGQAAAPAPPVASPPAHDRATRPRRFSAMRLLGYARREGMELLRDPIRLAFALLGPLILMVVFGYGISFDVEHLAYGVLDLDQSPESRAYLDNFAGSGYFRQRSVLRNHQQLEHGLRSGHLAFAVEIPPDFGKDLRRKRKPQVAVWLDGAIPFRAETSRGYVEGAHAQYLRGLAAARPRSARPAAEIETRYLYNQNFKSVYAMVPGVVMLLLMLIPSMMTAVGVVREKELGSITNLYATPVTRLEFLVGKQLPYIAVAMLSFVSLVALAMALFGVPVTGSLAALTVGALLYVVASTGFGLLVSSFVRTQIAAIFAAAILSIMPTISFSGFLSPVSSLEGGGRVVAAIFPTSWFQTISVGIFTKALGFADLLRDYLALAAFVVAYLALSLALLRQQER
jgi:ribosome-dependent ATPase